MGLPPKDGKLLYHLTSLENLKKIVELGLCSRKGLENFFDVANQEIINCRKEMELDSYIPFHFFAGTPFDGAVQLEFLDKKFVFIAITREFAKENNFIILKQHPLTYDCTKYSYDDGIEVIDWGLMETRDYHDKKCSDVCMAECLSPKTIPAEDFYTVFVKDEECESMVLALISELKIKDLHITVNSAIFIK